MSLNKKDSYIFYRSFYEAMEDLADSEQLDIYRAITIYALEGKEPDMTSYPKAIFRLIKPQLDANTKRYENGKKGAEFGKFGGRPKKETPEKPLNNPTETPNKNKNDNLNENNNENLESKKEKTPNPKGKNIDFENFILSIPEEWKPVVRKWLDYKKEKGQSYKGQTSLTTMFEELQKKSNENPNTAIEIINNSIANNWTGFFKIKAEKSEYRHPATEILNEDIKEQAKRL